MKYTEHKEHLAQTAKTFKEQFGGTRKYNLSQYEDGDTKTRWWCQKSVEPTVTDNLNKQALHSFYAQTMRNIFMTTVKI